MCIIAAKPAGVKLPERDVFRTMWDGNSDGAGFMYVENGHVKIEKGFMKYKNFTKALDKVAGRLDLTKTPMVFHFRITTHGGTKPENTHPFPITDNIGALKKHTMTTDVGVAHNGIIDILPRKGISDTMEYIASQLAPLKRALPKFYENKHAMQLIKNAISSKMVFLTKEGKLYTIGDFITEDGIMYSNDSYKKQRYNWRSTYPSYYDETYGWYGYDYKGSVSKTTTVIPEDYEIVDMMWLEDNYVMTTDGVLDEGYDYLMDSRENVWRYDWVNDYAVKAPGYYALDEQLQPVRYNEDLSEPVMIGKN